MQCIKQQELMSDLINSNVERMPLKNITNNNSRIVSTSSSSSSKINSDSVFNGENISNPVFNKSIQQHTSFPSEAPRKRRRIIQTLKMNTKFINISKYGESNVYDEAIFATFVSLSVYFRMLKMFINNLKI